LIQPEFEKGSFHTFIFGAFFITSIYVDNKEIIDPISFIFIAMFSWLKIGIGFTYAFYLG